MTSTTALEDDLKTQITSQLLHESLLNNSEACFVRALYPFESDEPSSLTFVPGDLIRVLTKLDSGWWDGLLHGRRGWFPSNYVEGVEVIDSDEEGDDAGDDMDHKTHVDTQSSLGMGEDSTLANELGSNTPRENTVAAFWIPQTTIEGRLFYFNTKTGVSKWEVPFVPLDSVMVNSELSVERVTPITSHIRPPLDEDPGILTPPAGHQHSSFNHDAHVSLSSGGWRDIDGNDVLEEEQASPENEGEILLFTSPNNSQTNARDISGLGQVSFSDHQAFDPLASRANMLSESVQSLQITPSKLVPEDLLSQIAQPAPGLGVWEQQLSIKSDALLAAAQSRTQEDYQSICHAQKIIITEMLQSLGLTSISTRESARAESFQAWEDQYRTILLSISKLILSAHIASNPWAPDGAVEHMLDDNRNVHSTVCAFIKQARQSSLATVSIKPTAVANRPIGGAWNANGMYPGFSGSPSDRSDQLDDPLSLSPESISIIENLAMSVHAGVRLCKSKVRQFEKEPRMSTASIIVRDTTEVLQALKKVLARCEHLDLSVLSSPETTTTGQSPTIVDFSKSKQSIYDAAGHILLAAQAITRSSVMGGIGFSEQVNAVKFINKSYGELETALQATIMHAEFMVQELVSRYSQGSLSFNPQESNGAKRDGKMRKFFGDEAPDSPIMLMSSSMTLPQQKASLPEIPRQEQTPWFLDHDLESDLSYDPSGNVRAGTLLALVERLTRHDILDSVYNNTFLLTYQSFTTASELTSLLMQRFLIDPPAGLTTAQFELWVEKKQNPIRLRVFKIFKSWMENFFMEPPTDATREWLLRLKDFAQNVLSTHIGGGPVLVKLIEKRIVHGDVPFRKLIPNNLNPAPPPILPRNLKKVRLLDLDPLEVARQITILESTLYSKIKPRECLDKSWSKAPGTTGDTNIRDMIEQSNRITAWVAEAILYQTDLKKRVSLIKHFVTIAEKCRLLNNFSTVTAIISGLNSAPIHRLRRTWDHLNARVAMSAEDLNRLMTSSKNFSIYRETLHQMQPPCVPFLGVYLTDLTFIEDGNPDMSVKARHLINISKRRKTADVIRDIQQYQTVPYTLTPVPEIQEYIKNCMDITRDVNELYTTSLEREPREREDEKIARLLQESGFL